MVKNDSFFLWTDAQSWHNTEKFFEDTKKRTESEKQLSGKRKDEKMEEVMILADKIINLRKKNGWSQEELAEKLGVTRQSISKYEGAQSIPDLDKILKLSEIFGVTTDYLIKDELEEEEYASSQMQENESESDRSVHKVTMEMANEYLQIIDWTAGKTAFATMLCILSPIVLLMLGAMSELPDYHISENAAAGIGICVLIVLIAIAVTIFILCGMKTKKYEFMEKEDIETAYGVSGMVKEKRDAYHSMYVTQLVIGIACCICSVIPLFGTLAVSESDFYMVSAVCMLLALVAIGTYFIVRSAAKMNAMNQLLEEEDYTRQKKHENRKMSGPVTVYWLIATAIYLAWSFTTNDWDRTWIIWPVVGVLFPAFYAIVNGIRKKS
ncbi:DNA-binding helix-turn-helix protein [Roseburia inulinivorans DSM 16841]|uniref:DNA-binding helix-turn-helix protein n=2 Tax=Roseburia inulinivorans TaxID=360807 RepID=C0FTE8_9FIRM|nr:DNA-binding helix-turn-helix protein [Roseburia inulinivorans DSM 16841]